MASKLPQIPSKEKIKNVLEELGVPYNNLTIETLYRFFEKAWVNSKGNLATFMFVGKSKFYLGKDEPYQLRQKMMHEITNLEHAKIVSVERVPNPKTKRLKKQIIMPKEIAEKFLS